MQARGYSSTYAGRRSTNEDASVVRDDIGLFVVADGVGGYAGGEVASTLAVDVIHGFFEGSGEISESLDPDGRFSEARMYMALRLAHREVRAERCGRLASMGTTIAVLKVQRRRAVIAHVGDSRIYRLRRGELTQLTADHIASAVDAGGGLHTSPSHAITRALGTSEDLLPEIRSLRLQSGDRFLLTTDGVTDVLGADRLAALMSTLPLPLVSAAIVREAWEQGSSDNMTAIAVEVERASLRLVPKDP